MYSSTIPSVPNSYLSTSLSQSLNTLSSSSSSTTTNMQSQQPTSSSSFFPLTRDVGQLPQRTPNNSNNSLPNTNNPSSLGSSRNYINNIHSLTVNTALPKTLSPSFSPYNGGSLLPSLLSSSPLPTSGGAVVSPSGSSGNTTNIYGGNYIPNTINAYDTIMDPLSFVGNVDQVRKLSLYFNNATLLNPSSSESTLVLQSIEKWVLQLQLQPFQQQTKGQVSVSSVTMDKPITTTVTSNVSQSSSSSLTKSSLPVEESFIWLMNEPVPVTTKLSLSSINWTQAIMDIFALIGTTSLTQDHINKGIELLCTSSLTPSPTSTSSSSSSMTSSTTTPIHNSLHSPTFIHHAPFQITLLPNYIKNCPALAAALLYGILRSCSHTVSEPYLRLFIDNKTYSSSSLSPNENNNNSSSSNTVIQHLETINSLLSYTKKYTLPSTMDVDPPNSSIIIPIYARIFPMNFVTLYSGMLLTQCENTKDKYAQNRLVRLVCMFIQTLIQQQFILLNPGKITSVTDDYSMGGDELPAFLAHLETFCVEFARVTDAVNLYKLLKK